MRYTARTDVGQKRDNNEDFLYAKIYNDSTALFVVADGLGGYSSGEVASQIAVNTIKDKFEDNLSKLQKYSEANVKDFLINLIEETNGKVFSIQNANDKYKGMATTVVLVAKINNKLYYESVGDSRLYYINPSKDNIEQISTDDTYVNELVKKKIIDKRDVENHPQKHILTKAVGIFSNVEVQFDVLDKSEGYLVLCSDGLTNMLTNEDILQTVNSENFLNLADKLVSIANANGGTDNITVIIVEL